ncbi:hypothetical protein, partial [Xanthomonas euvesicatoria]|uniref:hypothetical protein n=1 Tax=Xanthomonas euvesicatoria TaxID=456327 RepID=UPI0006D6697A
LVCLSAWRAGRANVLADALRADTRLSGLRVTVTAVVVTAKTADVQLPALDLIMQQRHRGSCCLTS